MLLNHAHQLTNLDYAKQHCNAKMIFIVRHLVFPIFDIAIKNTLILQFRCLSKLKLKSNDISIFVLNKINMFKNDKVNDQMFNNA